MLSESTLVLKENLVHQEVIAHFIRLSMKGPQRHPKVHSAVICKFGLWNCLPSVTCNGNEVETVGAAEKTPIPLRSRLMKCAIISRCDLSS